MHHNKDPVIQHSQIQIQSHRVTLASQTPQIQTSQQTSQTQTRPINQPLKVRYFNMMLIFDIFNFSVQIQPATNQSTFVIPWHSIVPLLTATSGPMSPVSQLSPPLSATPVSTFSGPSIDIQDDENDVEVMPVPTEEDDDVFENETTDSNLDNSNNKRRSQSLSALQNNSKETNKVV